MRVAIIGAGFSGLSAAAYAAKQGNEVHIFEKNSSPGGRARQFTTDEGYTFDMGPSWYWMPDIIEEYFADFGFKSSDFYELISLEPQFELIFNDGKIALPKDMKDQKKLFENIEKGAGHQLEKFMQAAKFKYEAGMKDFVNKPSHSWSEFISPKHFTSALRLNLFTNFRTYIARYFTDKKLRTLMEFPVIFLGASPREIPALYSLMNYGGYGLGTHYPMGGFYQLVLAMTNIAEKQGATFHFNSTIESINTVNNKVNTLTINGETHSFDAVIATSDYHHTETLLSKEHRNYNEEYWAKKTFAPSSLIYYLGINQSIPNLKHHTLFFENDLDAHIDSIYGEKRWPEKPLFYCCNPSKTDKSVAPESKENLFLLMPLAIGIEDNESIREKYLQKMLSRIEKHTGIRDLESKIEYKRSYSVTDFISDYNAYKGNAYGLANTLNQTAVLKPKIRNKKITNLFYAGQLTVPGPGVPPAIISGRIVANEITNIQI